MSDQPKKIKVLIASILAGGGHNTIQELFNEQLIKSSKLDISMFRHSKKNLDKSNTTNSQHFPKLYDFAYKNLPSEIAALGTLDLLKECLTTLRDQKPDILLSTQNIIGFHFALARDLLHLDTMIMTCIPDYGPPPLSTFPLVNKIIRSDIYIVFEESTKDGFIKHFGLTENDIILTGYKTKDIFVQTAKSDITKTETIKMLKKDLGKNPCIKYISPTKKIITISGGNGGFTRKALPFLKFVSEKQKKQPSLMNKFQYFVICGKDEKLFKSLAKLNKNKSEWKNIIPLPWIGHEIYAPLLKITDYPLLVSVAPSTINEILTVSKSPLLIHKSRTGQEIPTREFVVKNGLAEYIPQKEQLFFKILKGFSENDLKHHKNNKDKYLEGQAKRFDKLEELIIAAYEKKVEKSVIQIEKTKKVRNNAIKIGLASIPVIAGLAFASVKFFSARNKEINGNKPKDVLKHK